MDGECCRRGGRNVRRLRTERQLSLGGLARQAGLAEQTPADLEGGRGNPTVETLLAVARALGVGAPSLLAEWGSPVVVRRAGDAAWAERPGGRRRELGEISGTSEVATAVVELPGRAAPPAPFPPGTLLHVYVVSGRVLAGPLDDRHRLGAGDLIRFPTDVPHVPHVLAASAGPAVVHVVTTVPRVTQFPPQ
ncbi:helix-turn-helix domain-containing protein [Geodermatophilus maliterrae]|uniref:Helix-turn-helix domain-containing protein n=1 Tax=Geodermatophilus maliterrae TaxID=3162531 RepID=A0ABV3XIK3_9ACTN